MHGTRGPSASPPDLSYYDLKLLGMKTSPRDVAVAKFCQDTLYYKKPIIWKHHEIVKGQTEREGLDFNEVPSVLVLSQSDPTFLFLLMHRFHSKSFTRYP